MKLCAIKEYALIIKISRYMTASYGSVTVDKPHSGQTMELLHRSYLTLIVFTNKTYPSILFDGKICEIIDEGFLKTIHNTRDMVIQYWRDVQIILKIEIIVESSYLNARMKGWLHVAFLSLCEKKGILSKSALSYLEK